VDDRGRSLMAASDLITTNQLSMIRRSATERWQALVSEGWITITGSSPTAIHKAIEEWMDEAEVGTYDQESASRAIKRILEHPESGDAPKPSAPPDWPGPDDRDWIGSNRIRSRCCTCSAPVEIGDGYSGVRNGPGKPEWLTYHRSGDERCVAAQSTDLDLSPLLAFLKGEPTGWRSTVFAHPAHAGGADPEVTRLKVEVALSPTGYWLVREGGTYGRGERYGQQNPGGRYQSKKAEETVRAILDDPRAALKAHFALWDKCGVCNKKLESDGAAYADNWNSVEEGIGPVCAKQLGLR
jgi:hypothetical protein